jgi:hypothetical protein
MPEWRTAGFCCTAALAVFVLFALARTTPATAGEPPGETDDITRLTAEEIEEIPELDPCDWYFVDQQLQEKSREVLRSWSCYTFRWVDSWPSPTESQGAAPQHEQPLEPLARPPGRGFLPDGHHGPGRKFPDPGHHRPA